MFSDFRQHSSTMNNWSTATWQSIYFTTTTRTRQCQANKTTATAGGSM